MTIELICKGCSRKLRVADEHAGKHARCPECGEINPIVGAGVAGATSGGPQFAGNGSLDATQAYAPATGAVGASAPAGPAGEANPFQWSPPTPSRATASTVNPFADKPSIGPTGFTPVQVTGAPHRGVLILVFGILGWTVCFIFSILAWVWGAEDMRKMRRGLMDSSGLGLTQAGMIIGMIHCGLSALMFVFFFVMMVVGAFH